MWAPFRRGLLRVRPLVVHHVFVDESRWVRFEGGPEHDEYRPVRLEAGRLPRVVQVPEGAGERLVVHVYELVEFRPGAAKVLYRWLDPEG